MAKKAKKEEKAPKAAAHPLVGKKVKSVVALDGSYSLITFDDDSTLVVLTASLPGSSAVKGKVAAPDDDEDDEDDEDDDEDEDDEDDEDEDDEDDDEEEEEEEPAPKKKAKKKK